MTRQKQGRKRDSKDKGTEKANKDIRQKMEEQKNKTRTLQKKTKNENITEEEDKEREHYRRRREQKRTRTLQKDENITKKTRIEENKTK